ncbi:hypothetical protein OA88_16075 [Flavobacterium sp. JRM]|nr:hypothetical protein OA88_16075 [Flavobacterium sp. JRM]
MKKIISALVVTLLIIVLGCKKTNEENQLNSQINDTKDSVSNNVLGTKLNDTLEILDNNTVVFFEPSTTEIEELKKKHGDDDFYIIADDVAGYLANITEQLDSKKIKYITTDKSVVNFKKMKLFFDKNQLKSKWSILYLNKNNSIDIVAPIDFDINKLSLSKKLDMINGMVDMITQLITERPVIYQELL